MTRDKDFKRLVRARASEVGERYTTALQAFLRQREEARMIRVTCEVRLEKLTADQLQAVRERQSQAEARLREKHANAIVARAGEEQPILLLTEVGRKSEAPDLLRHLGRGGRRPCAGRDRDRASDDARPAP